MIAAERRVYLSRLVGKPYLAGAQGPDAYDCEGLARDIMARVFGVELPSAEDVLAQRRNWTRLALPCDGSVMFTGVGNSDRHVGVYLREGGVMHAVEDQGVVFDPLNVLALRLRAKTRFYRFA